MTKATADVATRLLSRGNVCIVATSSVPANPRATLVVCHGIGEHSGRYRDFCERLFSAEIASVRFDLRGHGQSGGPRGHVRRFSEYLDDLECVLSHFAGEVDTRVPWFLLGHSMGGVVVTQFLLSRRPLPGPSVRGLLLSSPGFLPSLPISRFKIWLSRLLLGVLPGLRSSSGIRPDQLTSDPVQRRAFAEDPDTYGRVSLRWYAEFQRAARDCLSRANELTLPIYACVGSSDPVVSPDGARRLIESASSSDKTLCVHEGLLHEPLNEIGGEQVARAMIEWIMKHSGESTPPAAPR